MSHAYLVESYWPGVSESALERALARFALGQEQDGTGVLGSILVPEDEIALSLVSGRSATAIRRASERAGLPCERIVKCVQIGPRDPNRGGARERHVP